MAKAHTPGKMVQIMWVNGKTINFTVRELILFLVAINTSGNARDDEDILAKARIPTQMVINTMVNGRLEPSMAKERGRRPTESNMKVNGKMVIKVA